MCASGETKKVGPAETRADLENDLGKLFSKVRRRCGEIGKGALRMDFFCPLEKHFFAFNVIRVWNAAINGADCRALLLIKMSDAFRAFFRNDVIEIVREGIVHGALKLPLSSASVNCRVRTFRLACAAVNTLLGDHCGHKLISLLS